MIRNCRDVVFFLCLCCCVSLVSGWALSGSPRKSRVPQGVSKEHDSHEPPRRDPLCQPWQEAWRALLSCSFSLIVSFVPISASSYDWDLLNGSVSLPDSLSLHFADRQTHSMRSLELTRPQIVGAGGGGAVFAFHDESTSQDEEFLLKISWEGTSKTVQRECSTLQLLEDRGVQAAERCWGSFDYPRQSKEKVARTMILVSPYMRDAVASVGQVATFEAQQIAVEEIARTLVQMLAANVITIDVQPLISKTSGKTIFIDMTEAQVLSLSGSYSFLDQSLISSFTSEMVALIPEDFWNVAKKATMEELRKSTLSQEDFQRVVSILEDQTPYFAST